MPSTHILYTRLQIGPDGNEGEPSDVTMRISPAPPPPALVAQPNVDGQAAKQPLSHSHIAEGQAPTVDP